MLNQLSHPGAKTRCAKYSMMLHAVGMVRGGAKKEKRVKGPSDKDLMENDIKEAAET